MPTGHISKVMMPDIAAMDTLIQLQRYTTTSDDYGGQTKTWATYSNQKAKREYAATGSGEDFTGHINLSVNRVLFSIRWTDGVTVKDRILYADEAYDITRIEEMGRRKFLKITADRKL